MKSSIWELYTSCVNELKAEQLALPSQFHKEKDPTVTHINSHSESYTHNKNT